MQNSNSGDSDYVKFACFVTETKLQDFKRWAKKKRARLVRAKNKACEVLNPRVQAGFVAPKVWDRDCRRQGAWYRESREAGNYLIVSNVPMEGMAGGSRLTISDFSPSLFPTTSELHDLVHSPEYERKKPWDWEQCTEEDRLKFVMGRDIIKQTLGEMPSCKKESLDDVIISHCANHSNFLSPRFFVKQDGRIYPYSIGDTFHVCSACLEFFNLLGKQHRVKYVVPCPGAVTTAELPIHRYIRVETIV